MSTEVQSNQVFEVDGNAQVISLVATGTGTSTLQKLAGNDTSGTWVSVTDGAITNAGEITFWAPKGQKYRVTLSGTQAYVSI